MSTGKKLLLLLLLLALLIGGWFFMNKPEISESSDPQNTEVTAEEGNFSNDIGHDESSHLDIDNIAGKGTVTALTVDPVLGLRGVGNPEAPIKIQEFFSLTCNHCADFHTSTYQQLKAKYIDTGKVYFIFQEFPLNGPALYGSMIARCMPEERYEGFIDLLLRNQDVWAFSGDFKSALQQNAKLAGMSDEEFETCFNNQDLQKAIAMNISTASNAYNISSTPSFVFNDGERIMSGGKAITAFDAVIEDLMNGAPNEGTPSEVTE
jgi:protein-disulfide isomerase